jgi:starch synthase
LAGQKGIDLLPEVLPALLAGRELRLVVLGSGEARYEQLFASLHTSFPGKVCFHRGFSNELAHWIEAGADLFLMPSKYEPCGLNQMYSLLYGTVPVVRRTGGLADTVTLWDPKSREGNGIVFDHYTPEGVRWGLETALSLYSAGWEEGGRARDSAWRHMQLAGMAQDFSWERQAQQYVDLYRSLAPD